MNFKEWLSNQIVEVGIDPTSLSRLVDGLNQPTIQRVLSGETKNPGIGTVTKIRAAVDIARSAKGLPINIDLPPLAEPLPTLYNAQPEPKKTRAQKIGAAVAQLPENSPLLDAIDAMLKGAGVAETPITTGGYIDKAIKANERFATKVAKKRTGTS